jgi:metallo-beta-lactamase family protein
MAIDASGIYWEYPELLDEETIPFRNDKSIKPHLKNLHFTPKPKQSKAINAIKSGAIVIAGSGMCNGGRNLHNLKHNIQRSECSLVMTGFQAEGILGRSLVNGDKEVVIHGDELVKKVFRDSIEERLHFRATIPKSGDIISFGSLFCSLTLWNSTDSYSFAKPL